MLSFFIYMCRGVGRCEKWRKNTKETQKQDLNPNCICIWAPWTVANDMPVEGVSTFVRWRSWNQGGCKDKVLKGWSILEERTRKNYFPLASGRLASTETEPYVPSLVHEGLSKVWVCMCTCACVKGGGLH